MCMLRKFSKITSKSLCGPARESNELTREAIIQNVCECVRVSE